MGIKLWSVEQVDCCLSSEQSFDFHRWFFFVCTVVFFLLLWCVFFKSRHSNVSIGYWTLQKNQATAFYIWKQPSQFCTHITKENHTLLVLLWLYWLLKELMLHVKERFSIQMKIDVVIEWTGKILAHKWRLVVENEGSCFIFPWELPFLFSLGCVLSVRFDKWM